MVHITHKTAEFASERRTAVSRDESFLPTGSTTISRRQAMALGITGLVGLLLPCREVLGQNLVTLGVRLSLELEQTDTEYHSRGIPELVRSQLEAAFKSDITDVVLSHLSIASDASSEELSQIKSSLDDGQFRLGTLTRDWMSGVLRSDNIVGVLRQNEDIRLRLDLPSFQLPFIPDYGFNLGATKPSTTQTPPEFLQALRANASPFDPTKVRLTLDPFAWQAADSATDSQQLTWMVEADKFFDKDFKFDPARWKAIGEFISNMDQNGFRNRFKGFLQGEGGFPGGPWQLIGGVMLDF